MNPSYAPGYYKVRITRWSLGKAGTGTPQFALSFNIIGMVNQEDPEGELVSVYHEERTIFRAITDKTVDFVTEDLRHLGFEGTSFAQLDPTSSEAGATDFRGLEIMVRCDHETYQGQPKERWSFAWGGGKFQQKPLEKTELQKLDAMFGRKLKESAVMARDAKNASERAKVKAPPYTQPKSGEEIPF